MNRWSKQTFGLVKEEMQVNNNNYDGSISTLPISPETDSLTVNVITSLFIFYFPVVSSQKCQCCDKSLLCENYDVNKTRIRTSTALLTTNTEIV